MYLTDAHAPHQPGVGQAHLQCECHNLSDLQLQAVLGSCVFLPRVLETTFELATMNCPGHQRMLGASVFA